MRRFVPLIITSKQRLLILLTATLLLILTTPKITHAQSYYNCDSDSIPDTKKASSLIPNTFYKICPATRANNKPFGQPICGDGTSFSFYYTRPPQRVDNNKKILIEFMGGGACWDGDTCAMQAQYGTLTFPTKLDGFLGNSCTEVEVAMSMNGAEVSALCAKEIGDVDFTGYNTIVVPYCTQDVFIGDKTVTYYNNDDDGNGDDDGSGTVIHHHGAHNMMAVLNWVFKNFPHPNHIALTGCSAGGTALPVAYDLLNKHYNSKFKAGLRSVQINVVSDSPVYLTPSYFLSTAFDSWNPKSLMKRLHFNFNKHRYDEDYPTEVWDHVLKRGPNKDQWGFVTHTEDSISQLYYRWMSGNGNGEDDDTSSSDWWNELSTSLSTVQSKHKNVETYLIEGDSHCTFGLYYPLLEDGFASWAGNIFHETIVLGSAHCSVPLFITSIAIGMAMLGAISYSAKKHSRQSVGDGLNEDIITSNQHDGFHKSSSTKVPKGIAGFFAKFRPYPVTTAYFLIITFYFFTMLIASGFDHPLDNPSLGPSAVFLHLFGINNPTLIVYQHQVWRVLTSNFLCSGILTYLMAVLHLYAFTRHVEYQLLSTVSSLAFPTVLTVIGIGSNLLYAFIANGASCASLAIVLGINVFSIVMRRKLQEKDYTGTGDGVAFPHPIWHSIMLFIVVCVLFPFNSWIILLCGMFVGGVIAPLLIGSTLDYSHNLESRGDEDITGTSSMDLPSGVSATPKRMVVQWTRTYALCGVYFIAYLLLGAGVRKPQEIYQYPYLTGCNLVYATDISSIIEGYVDSQSANDDDGDNGQRRHQRRRRHLSGDSGDGGDDNDWMSSMCAQLCIPHLVYNPLLWGVHKFSILPVQHGMCEENGYTEHFADKTFSAFTFSVDVEIYMKEDDDE